MAWYPGNDFAFSAAFGDGYVIGTKSRSFSGGEHEALDSDVFRILRIGHYFSLVNEIAAYENTPSTL